MPTKKSNTRQNYASTSGPQDARRGTSYLFGGEFYGEARPRGANRGTERPIQVDKLIVGHQPIHGSDTGRLELRSWTSRCSTYSEAPSRRGSWRGPRLDGVTRTAGCFSQATVLRVGQGLLPLYRRTQHRSPWTSIRCLKGTRFSPGSLIQGELLRDATPARSQLGCRPALGGGRSHGGVGTGATPGSRDFF